MGAGDAVDVAVLDAVVHDVEARGTHDGDVCRVHAEELRREGAGGGQAVGSAVVIGVDALVGEVGVGGEQVEHGLGKRGLLGAGLAAGHVELEVEGLEVVRLALELGEGGVEGGVGHVLVHVGHGSSFGFPPFGLA